MRLLALPLVFLVACSGNGGGGTGGGAGGTTGTGGGDTTGTGGGTSGAGGGTSGAGGGTTGAGGGTTGTGGGTTGTGGGTASGGSGGSTGAGGGSSAGVGTFLRVGMYDLAFAGGADGTMHLLFNEGAAERVFYARCSSACSSASSWTAVQLASVSSFSLTAIGAEGLGLDSSGRLHAVIAGVPPLGSSANRMVYATCASNCTTATSWTLVDLTSVAQGDTISTNETFMVSPGGQLSFLTSGQTSSYSSRYVSCAASCTQLGSWSAGPALNGNPLYARRDAAGVTHVVLQQGTTAMGDDLHFYARCASGCDQGAGWQVSPLGFIYRGGGYTAGFAVTPSGKLFLSYNQGNAMVSTADNRKLFINACTSGNCLDLNTWSSFSLGSLDEGTSGSWLENDGEELALATDDEFELKLRVCGGNCQAAASWSAPVVIDNSTAMNQSVPPDSGSSCPGTSQSATWWPNRPSIGISATGLVVGHAPYAIVKCPANANPSRLPTIGRIYSTF